MLSKRRVFASQIVCAMAPNTPLKLISVDVSKHPSEQPCLHNRWHPDIPPVRQMLNAVGFTSTACVRPVRLPDTLVLRRLHPSRWTSCSG